MRWLTERQLMAYLNVSRATARKFAAEAGAVYHIGRLVRYDREAIDAALTKKESHLRQQVTLTERKG